jgi:group II intron reverse transcriptase/maturase
MSRTVGLEKDMQTSLRSMAKKAGKQKKYRFQNLYGMLDEHFLKVCFFKLNKKAASGVDGVTWKEYRVNLNDNIHALVERLKAKRYRARLVKRQYIPKAGGKLRPLGLPVLEDKLVQLAVSTILSTIWEQDFSSSSCGYRPKVGAKTGVKLLLTQLRNQRFNHVVEADIKGFFNNIDHAWLLQMLEQRIDDSALLRLIEKWLKAGVLEDGSEVIHPATGTPQGGVISPILANIYLHYVLDLWFEKVVSKHCVGRIFFVRYADDFVCLFKEKKDAENFYSWLPERMAKFNLELAPDKTQIVPFTGKPFTERFIFLGFEFYRGLTRTRKIWVYARTAPKRMRASLARFTEWLRENISLGTSEIFSRIRQKLTGYYNYFGVTGNFEMLSSYFYYFAEILRRHLIRRSQRSNCTRGKFQRLLRIYGVPRPRIKWSLKEYPLLWTS